MIATNRLVTLALALMTFALASTVASAQEALPTAAPAAASSQTLLDREYDGRWHVTVAPYLWLPTLRSNVQYTIPKLRGGAGPTFATNVQVGPSDYLTKINSAGMLAFNVRRGGFELLGDYIFTNLSSNANVHSTIGGPKGKIEIPVSFATNSRLATSIWELAAGFSLAHGRSGDANFFAGWRQFPLTTNLDYVATIDSKVTLTRSGTVRIAPLANDVIFGFNGKVLAGDHWFAPYYIDFGTGANQQTWEGYGGAGYAFDHGQTLIAAFRTLNYNGFPPHSPVKKLNMWGPLLGYTLHL